MAGVTMITNDDYKELILAQQKVAEYEDALHQIAEELKFERGHLANLLLCITKGEKTSKWQDGKFEGFDLAEKDDIAKYINETFVEYGRLILRENDNA